MIEVPLPDGPSTPALDQLNARRRAFVLHYVLGEDGVRGIIWKAYLAAGYEANNQNTAGSAGYQVLQNATVKLAIDELKNEVDREMRAKLKPWAGMAGKAQDLLERAIETMVTPELGEDERKIASVAGINVPKIGYLPDGRPRTRLDSDDMSVIKEVLDRALGRATQPHVLELGDKLNSTIRRLSEEARQRSLVPGQKTSEVGHLVKEIEVPLNSGEN